MNETPLSNASWLYPEDQLLPISALQHLAFCERQCALIHLEQAWTENRFTAEGRVLHENVHEGGSEARRDLRLATGLRLRSLRLGLSGQADLVEFHRQESSANAVRLSGIDGWWRPFPVEYKRGRPKAHDADEVQLCAQAVCLEEMLGVAIPAGALFYGASRRRREVVFSLDLRAKVEQASRRLHQLLQEGRTPAAVYQAEKCDHCSLLEQCQPRLAVRTAEAYLHRMLEGEE